MKILYILSLCLMACKQAPAPTPAPKKKEPDNVNFELEEAKAFAKNLGIGQGLASPDLEGVSCRSDKSDWVTHCTLAIQQNNGGVRFIPIICTRKEYEVNGKGCRLELPNLKDKED